MWITPVPTLGELVRLRTGGGGEADRRGEASFEDASDQILCNNAVIEPQPSFRHLQMPKALASYCHDKAQQQKLPPNLKTRSRMRHACVIASMQNTQR